MRSLQKDALNEDMPEKYQNLLIDYPELIFIQVGTNFYNTFRFVRVHFLWIWGG